MAIMIRVLIRRPGPSRRRRGSDQMRSGCSVKFCVGTASRCEDLRLQRLSTGARVFMFSIDVLHAFGPTNCVLTAFGVAVRPQIV
jgi:hypothetical protein